MQTKDKIEAFLNRKNEYSNSYMILQNFMCAVYGIIIGLAFIQKCL